MVIHCPAKGSDPCRFWINVERINFAGGYVVVLSKAHEWKTTIWVTRMIEVHSITFASCIYLECHFDFIVFLFRDAWRTAFIHFCFGIVRTNDLWTHPILFKDCTRLSYMTVVWPFYPMMFMWRSGDEDDTFSYMRVEQKVHEKGFLCVGIWVRNKKSRLKYFVLKWRRHFFLLKFWQKIM